MSKLSAISVGLAALMVGGTSSSQEAGQADAAATATATPAPSVQQVPVAPPLPSQASVIAAEELVVPIHSHPDDPDGGPYGIWAAGPNYKASFHEGYEFFPLLGPDYPENLPLRWTTESVTAGGQRLFAEGTMATHHRAALRYEYRFPGVVEGYDIRIDGVEQTFTLAARPAHAGDLLIRGKVETKLRAARRLEDEHGEITFRDADGKDILTYGEAFAIDALGKKTNVTTSFDGAAITLKVPAAWLAQAVYPVVVDPLTANVTISTWGGGTFGLASYPAVGREEYGRDLMTFYARQFSASDFDGYARLTNNDFSNSRLVYTDITTTWSSARAGVSCVGGTYRWALCLERDFGATGSNVRVYLHDFGNTTLNSGTTLFVTRPAGESFTVPEIGGTRSLSPGSNALLVFQADVSTGANTPNSEVWGMLVDTSGAGSLGARFLLGTASVGRQFDRELPAVNQESVGSTASWIVAWQEFDRTVPGDDWDAYIARITSTGVRAGVSVVGPSASAAHKLNPRVAGREGRYMASYRLDSSAIGVHRFDWLDTGRTPVMKQINVVASGGVADYVNGGIAFDTITDSHWGVIYQRGPYTSGAVYVARVGYTGGPTERATVYSTRTTGGYSPSIAFDDYSQSFLLVYASTENPPSGLPVYARKFDVPSTAVNVHYGVGCGPATIHAAQPLAGHEFFRILMIAGAAAQPAILIQSNAAAAIPLASSGMGPCVFNLDPGLMVAFATATDGVGSATLYFPVPDDPVFIGDVYWQWFYGYPAAPWPTRFAGTHGLRTQIR